MRVFNNSKPASITKKPSKKMSEKASNENTNRMVQYSKPGKSRSEILAKVEKMKNKKNLEKAKTEIKKNGFDPSMDRAEKMEQKAKEVVGDVGINDPNDTNTHEKLKRSLSMGTFSFDDKTREVLDSIINK